MSSVPLATILAQRMNWRVEGRVLRRKVKASKHVLRLPEPSWAFDANLYAMLRRDFDTVEVTDRESGTTYTVSASTFDAHATRCDLGHGLQLRLALRLWKAERLEGAQLPLPFPLKAAS